MTLIEHYQRMASYNRIANEKLYEAVAQLEDGEYRLQRKGSFGSIHALLNHALLADGIWMSRFEGGGKLTPPLNTILHEAFAELRAARVEMDTRMEIFFAAAQESFTERELHYVNSMGVAMSIKAPIAVAHFFNHQTHHRAQVHVMLSQTAVAPPGLDLVRFIRD